MFHSATLPYSADIPQLLDSLARTSSRPRYAFMILSLIAKVANSDGEAGPFIHRNGERLTLRDFLCDSLTPMGMNGYRRRALVERVASDLAKQKLLPADPHASVQMIDDEVRRQVRTSGKANLSRAVSELVEAGLLRRYYKGYAVDHKNRGGQRHAVYVLCGRARCLAALAAPGMIASPDLAPSGRAPTEFQLPLPNFP